MSNGRAQILLVEDDTGTATLARRRLERAGYAVASAASAAAARQYLRQHVVDLILLDNRLPGETGLELYRELKASGFDIPAILMTGFANEQTVISALRIGMRDFIPKSPEFIDYLPEAVDRVLGQVEMERRLAEERLKLSQEQAARAEAEAASTAKDFFLATLSHELRTPLQAISGWLQLLRSGQLTPEDRARALDTIQRNVEHQTELIEDLLDVSRIISGKLELDRAGLDIGALAQELVDAAQQEAAPRRIALVLERPPSPLFVHADRKRIKQVVSNLLSNALKFTPPGGKIVLRVAGSAGTVRLAVEDTGPGIDRELLPRIFEPFSQGAGPDKPGLGLGLSIARHLVQAHGGTIEAANGPGGKGAAFVVELPAIPAKPAESAALAPPARPERATPVDGVRVLIVDDDDDSRELMCYALSARRAEVRSAASAGEALALLDGFPADVIVTDIAMPGGDGYQLLRELRQRHGNVPAVAFTAHASKQDRSRALEAGFDAYVAKPVDPFELLQLVSEVHRSRRAQPSIR